MAYLADKRLCYTSSCSPSPSHTLAVPCSSRCLPLCVCMSCVCQSCALSGLLQRTVTQTWLSRAPYSCLCLLRCASQPLTLLRLNMTDNLLGCKTHKCFVTIWSPSFIKVQNSNYPFCLSSMMKKTDVAQPQAALHSGSGVRQQVQTSALLPPSPLRVRPASHSLSLSLLPYECAGEVRRPALTSPQDKVTRGAPGSQ